jgi:hypothetical protein
MVVVGFRPARRSGGATGAWNRCDAFWEVIGEGKIVERDSVKVIREKVLSNSDVLKDLFVS